VSAWINAAEFCAEFDYERLERSSPAIARTFDRPRVAREPTPAEREAASRACQALARRQARANAGHRSPQVGSNRGSGVLERSDG
jgi:hypothetical protein